MSGLDTSRDAGYGFSETFSWATLQTETAVVSGAVLFQPNPEKLTGGKIVYKVEFFVNNHGF